MPGFLDRRLYLGEITWNRRAKRDTWGHVAAHARAETEWIRTEAPHLRIVSDAEWRAAHARLDGIHASLRTLTNGRAGSAPGARL